MGTKKLKERETQLSAEKQSQDNIFELEKRERGESNLLFHIPEGIDAGKRETRVQIEDEHGQREVELRKVFELIKKNPRIRKVIVEEVGFSDLKRMNFLFDHQDAPEEGLEITAEKILALENEINQTPVKVNKKTDTANNGGRQLSEMSEETIFNEPQIISDKAEVASEDSRDFREVQEVTESREGKRLKYEKSWFKVKKSRVEEVASHYFLADKHLELYKLGNSYYGEYLKGVKSFGFCNVHAGGGKERTMLGLCFFFSYHAQVIPTILTDDIEGVKKQDVLENENHRIEEVEIPDEDFSLKVHIYGGVSFIDVKELKTLSTQLIHHDFNALVNYVTENSELLLVDFPSLKTVENNVEMFFPLLQEIDNITFVIKPNGTRFKQLDKFLDFFEKYQIPVKGVVMSNVEDN